MHAGMYVCMYIYIYIYTCVHVVRLRPRPKEGQRPMATEARHARGQNWQAMKRAKGGDKGGGQGVDKSLPDGHREFL